MLLASQFHHVCVRYVRGTVGPVGAGASCKVHQVFRAADFVCVSIRFQNSLEQ